MVTYFKKGEGTVKGKVRVQEVRRQGRGEEKTSREK